MRRAALVLAPACVAALATAAPAHNGGFTALAVPVDSIAVDGVLDDWPDAAPTYSLDAVLQDYRTYDDEDPGPEDLSARFRVAWSPRAQRLFVAVEVRDDSLSIGRGHLETDAVEIYLDGTHGDRDPQQYLMFPGPGSYAPLGSSPNPALDEGDIGRSGAAGVWRARGDTLVYEWSLQAFESFPGRRARLAAGQRLGFDVVAVDKDAADKGPTWLSWSPQGGKQTHADRLGDVVLLSSTAVLARMGRVHGRVVLGDGEEGWRGLEVKLRDPDGKTWAAAITGPGGRFQLIGAAGKARIEVSDADPPASLELELVAGATAQPVIPVLQRAGDTLPAWPFTVVLGLFGAACLGALVPLRGRLSLLGGALVAPADTFLQLARRPEWTAPAALALWSASLMSVALVNTYPGQLWGALMGMPGTLATILLLSVPVMIYLALVVLQFGSWMAWSFILWAAARQAGGRGRYFHLVSATGYAGVPALLGVCLASLALTFGRGGGDPGLSHLTGLAALGLADGPLGQALGRVEVFTLWSWVLGGVGVARVMGLSPKRAAGVTTACWALTLTLVIGFYAALRAVAAGLTAAA